MEKNKLMQLLNIAKKERTKLELEARKENNERRKKAKGCYTMADERSLKNYSNYTKASDNFFNALSSMNVGKFYGTIYEDRIFIVCDSVYKMPKGDKINDIINDLINISNKPNTPKISSRSQRSYYERINY